MKKIALSLLVAVMTATVCVAKAPEQYYKSCEGKSGQALLQALHSVIDNHTVVSYDGLWDVYKTSDVRSDGSVWDMYSTKQWGSNATHCGNYKVVGDCINREHSMPKSWFDDRTPMVSDAYHIYPTDGRVNGQRSNYPYGECSNGTVLPSNGSVKPLGRLGKSTFAGYTGTVFEPDDEYKGDFARTYFYMATRYVDRVSSWDSDMLAGNSYPVFSTWALNLLLKWHRQDPVSDKETTRNDAVYAHQKNRNPFIDHPELVEYIWGNSQNKGWAPDSNTPQVITAPVAGSTINIGITGLDIPRSLRIPVKGSGLKADVAVSVTGAGFSAGSTSLPADRVNAGTAGVDVIYRSSTPTTAGGTLTLTSGSITVNVNLTATAAPGLPVSPATDISETSFVAHWANIDGDGAIYSFALYLNDTMLPGYPVKVPAEDESLLVDNLEPDSHYAYTLSNGTITSDRMEVHTAVPMPSIQFLFDGDLEFTSRPGEPSDIAELLLDIENIPGDITITVTAPFELSTDKSSWNTSVTLTPGEDRVYLRLNGTVGGTYTTYLTASAADYTNDDTEVTGVIIDTAPFVETFEVDQYNPNYNSTTLTGTTGTWTSSNAGTFDATAEAYDGRGYCRFGKNANSYIATASAKQGGVGTVTFMAKPWSNDGAATIKVQYSVDGTTWIDAAQLSVTATDYTRYTATVNRAGNVYLKLQQTSGSRVHIDNITATDYTSVGSVSQLYYHSWDAYNRDSKLVIENTVDGARFNIYAIDGSEWFNDTLPAGETTVDLPRGLYIVVSDDFARRVVIK